jgi:hypothetical protein
MARPIAGRRGKQVGKFDVEIEFDSCVLIEMCVCVFFYRNRVGN